MLPSWWPATIMDSLRRTEYDVNAVTAVLPPVSNSNMSSPCGRKTYTCKRHAPRPFNNTAIQHLRPNNAGRRQAESGHTQLCHPYV